VSVVLSLQAPVDEGSRIEDYMRVTLPDDANVGDVRAALSRLIADWRGKGDGSTRVEWQSATRRHWKKQARMKAGREG
jgi:hypothetical protein